MKGIRSGLVVIFMVFTSLAYLLFTGAHRTVHLHKTADPFRAPPLVQLSPPLIQLMTLGHQRVYQDFIAIWLLQALMDEQIPKDSQKMMALIRSVLHHLPRFETSYMLSCIVMFEKFASPKHCQEISLLGLQAFPQSWRIPMLQGYVHTVLLGEPAQGAAFFKMAASRPDRPLWVQGLVDKLAAKKDMSQEDLNQGIEILSNSPSPEMYVDLIAKLKAFSQDNLELIENGGTHDK